MCHRLLWRSIAWRLIANWSIVIALGTLLPRVSPAPPTTHTALAVLAAVLGFLAAGIFTGYSSLSVADAPLSSIALYNLVDAIVFCCMYLLLYLSIYCLYRVGIGGAVGKSMEILLHLGVGILFSAMHLIDIWDRVQNIPGNNC